MNLKLKVKSKKTRLQSYKTEILIHADPEFT